MVLNVKESGLIGGLFALPWCCISPGIFSVIGLAGMDLSRQVTGNLSPILLVMSLFFLGRVHFLLYVKAQGSRTSAVVTWVSTLLG
jgi:hypothetical protein